MKFRHVAATVLAAATALLATAVPASAHAGLKSSNPAEGASLATAPSKIELTFGEAVKPNTITVTGADGRKWETGAPTVVDAVVTVPVTPAGPAGKYVIAYKVTSEDGDPVSGTVNFTLTAAVASSTSATSSSAAPTSSAPVTSVTPQPQAQNDSGSGFPAWGWVLIAIVVLAVIGGVLVARRRGPSTSGKE
ncbi:copper resistance CopC family protein [Amycolatopsis sp. SID8362]|uniref:copper resistance CopC family protein n=1 Tax=Amycolatopsis sp. SID8362 TaxID=2690346 RepID=UPI001368C88A|nr:copper resistance CopC family protein [Amycolatopsis sp. SID8362]NBH07462.1 copper resistance protein CopC [Amycolatopsis sp. SID8362]NED44158.1 copper resistance protein CopC [Amycolatopsis sp. SID8362]